MKLVIGAEKGLATDFTSRIFPYAREHGIEVIGAKRIIYPKIYEKIGADFPLIQHTWINFHIRHNMPPGRFSRKQGSFMRKNQGLSLKKSA